MSVHTGHMSLFLLGKFPEVVLLGHMISLCLTYEETAKLFSKVYISLYQQYVRTPVSPEPAVEINFFLIIAILVGI